MTAPEKDEAREDQEAAEAKPEACLLYTSRCV